MCLTQPVQVFDMARDVQQGSGHVDKLFEKKTCGDVLTLGIHAASTAGLVLRLDIAELWGT